MAQRLDHLPRLVAQRTLRQPLAQLPADGGADQRGDAESPRLGQRARVGVRAEAEGARGLGERALGLQLLVQLLQLQPVRLQPALRLLRLRHRVLAHLLPGATELRVAGGGHGAAGAKAFGLARLRQPLGRGLALLADVGADLLELSLYVRQLGFGLYLHAPRHDSARVRAGAAAAADEGPRGGAGLWCFLRPRRTISSALEMYRWCVSSFSVSCACLSSAEPASSPSFESVCLCRSSAPCCCCWIAA